jgi:hypothetical protein
MKEISDEARKLRNAYQRIWNKKNPGKIKQKNIDYWERKAMKAEETKNAPKK